MGLPSQSTSPAVGCKNPEIPRSSVDFPSPDGPIIATLAPLETLKSAVKENFSCVKHTFLRYRMSSSSLVKNPK